uniref:LYR motif-containing protein 2 n=1 Tax=Kryptolebias marmoratus TaxID=37003 RepID=A0A3Q3A377_KRYMA
MTVSRLPSATLSLKQYLQRQKVLAIYRNMLRTIRQVPAEEDRKYLTDWAREEFKRNKTASNQVNFCVLYWVIRGASPGDPPSLQRSPFKIFAIAAEP